MKILFCACLLLIIFLILLAVLMRKYIRLRSKIKVLQSDAHKLLTTIQRVRYGQLAVKVKDLSNKQLQSSVNRLIETLLDRESMIIEYQKNLSKKNASLEKMIKAEKELQRFKEDFIATLTHDLKTPVIAELNTLDLLLNDRLGSLNEKQKQALSLMKSSNEELLQMAEILLETYKIQQTAIELNKQKTNIVSFMGDIVQEMLPIAVNNGLYIDYDVQENEIDINFDRFQIKRVFKNLILNAISFSSKSERVRIFCFQKGQSVVVSIINHGNAISKEELALIFNKYYSSVKKFRKIGTGLGLYLANQIITAHNGSINVDSNDSDQTVFEVSLPLN